MTKWILTLLISLNGCANPSIEYRWDHGTLIQINHNTDCPDGSRNACAVGQGIYLPVWADHEYYIRHEIGHIHGMVHTEWVLQPSGELCATVTVQGASEFPVGYKFCIR